MRKNFYSLLSRAQGDTHPAHHPNQVEILEIPEKLNFRRTQLLSHMWFRIGDLQEGNDTPKLWSPLFSQKGVCNSLLFTNVVNDTDSYLKA